MDFVCIVGGNLEIADLNLNLVYMEIVDLYPDDFKTSPSLREAQRTKKIEVYSPQNHKLAKRIKTRQPFPPVQIIKEIVRETSKDTSLKEPLSVISNKLDYLMSKVDSILSKNKEPLIESIDSNNSIKEDILLKILEQNKKIEIYMAGKDNTSQEKIDKIINKFETLLEKGLSINKDYFEKDIITKHTREQVKEDIPIYVPRLDDIDVIEKNVQTEDIVSEGTESILEKLKKLKGNI